MPIHDVGYRGWEGERTSQLSRWCIISTTGIKLAAQSRWVRRILFVAWLPVMYWGIGFFFIENAISDDSAAVKAGISQTLSGSFAAFPHAKDLANSLASDDPAQIRNDVWRWLLMVFFRYPQAILILFLIGAVGPALISQDMRSRAFLLYFSRPIGKLEYMFGKLCIPAAFIAAVTTLPALALYAFAILMSPEFSVFWSTWDIPIRIILATFALVIPTSSVVLMLSSLTQESRFASFSWFALWALGHGAWMAIVVATAIQMSKPPFHPEVLNSNMVQGWSALSLYNCLGIVQSWIFGFQTFSESWRGIASLTAITTFSLGMLYRRVSAPIQV
ncbi:MAG: ABC-2 type transport system permease protein [Mariniblastus sp.]|jgi:ABC-2 type transport system permease protein